MNDREHARVLLAMAGKDLKALVEMGDPDRFDPEVFGFHAQQAVEKAVKAWAASLGIEYPLTHDLDFLFSLLRDRGAQVQSFMNLTVLTGFAVRYRYEIPDAVAGTLDRPGITASVQALFDHVTAQVG